MCWSLTCVLLILDVWYEWPHQSQASFANFDLYCWIFSIFDTFGWKEKSILNATLYTFGAHSTNKWIEVKFIHALPQMLCGYWAISDGWHLKHWELRLILFVMWNIVGWCLCEFVVARFSYKQNECFCVLLMNSKLCSIYSIHFGSSSSSSSSSLNHFSANNYTEFNASFHFWFSFVFDFVLFMAQKKQQTDPRRQSGTIT